MHGVAAEGKHSSEMPGNGALHVLLFSLQLYGWQPKCCDLLMFDVLSFTKIWRGKKLYTVPPPHSPVRMPGGVFALVFAILYNEIYRLIPRPIYTFWLINATQIHRPNTSDILKLSSSALWHILVAISDLLLQVTNPYYIDKKCIITHNMWISFPVTISKFNTVVAAMEEHAQLPNSPSYLYTYVLIYNKSDNAVQLEGAVLTLTCDVNSPFSEHVLCGGVKTKQFKC